MEYGFRLPCAFDNRPLKFEEFEERINQVIYVSATPGDYERERSGQIVEQVIRPTGLLDPKIDVRPIEGQIDDLMEEIQLRTEKDERTLITTLTKKMAEDLTTYLSTNGVRVRYMHSDVGAMERMEIIRGPAPGQIRRTGGYQPASRGPGFAGCQSGGHSGRRQGGLSPLRNQPDSDHRPRRQKRRGPGHPLR